MDKANQTNTNSTRRGVSLSVNEGYQLLYFSKLLGRSVRIDQTKKRTARLTDLVFRLSEHYPEAVGIYLEHGRGYPSELIPWEKVVSIEEEAIRGPSIAPRQQQPGRFAPARDPANGMGRPRPSAADPQTVARKPARENRRLINQGTV